MHEDFHIELIKVMLLPGNFIRHGNLFLKFHFIKENKTKIRAGGIGRFNCPV
jgi:hypothetical protein